MLTAIVVILAAAPNIAAAAPNIAAAAPKIAAAANLTAVLDDVLAQCHLEAKPTYGATGTLAAQIEQGAPFDLLLAADAATPAKLEQKHLGAGHSFAYARGRLSLWVPEGSKLDIEQQGLAALKDPSVQHIAIANPKLAPYGKLALEKLQAAGLGNEQKLVIGESVSQAAQFAQGGNAQAALLPLSLALGMKGRHVELEGATIEQRGLVIHDTPETKKLVECLLGEGTRAILERRGYAPP